MSPPIRDGSGSSIGSIRLGDGSEISEVRTGAGDVLFNANTIPDSVIDYFEENLYEDQNRTLSDIYNGDLSGWSRQQSTVFGGSYALETPSDGTFRHIADTDQLPTVAQGDTFSYRVYNQNSGDIQLSFANQSESGVENQSNYAIKYDSGFPAFSLSVFENGSRNEMALDTSTNLPTNEWVEIVVDWATDNTITVTLYNQSGSQLTQISTSDSTYTSGGIGYRYNTDGPHYIDNVGFV